MPRLAERQRTFFAALLDPSLGVPDGVVGPDGEPCPKRFAVYRNNVVVSLTDALGVNFPAVARIVGDEFFRAMARAYLVSGRSASPMMFEYGADFPSFIRGFEPAVSLPYLSDVARIERAWCEAYHASDATAMSPGALAAIPPACASRLRLAIHPSLRIVRSRWPALTIWRMNVGDGVPALVDLKSGGENALVIRPAAGVDVHAVPDEVVDLVEGLAHGRSLADVAAELMADAGFDLSETLRTLIEAGAIVGYRFAPEP